MKKEFCYSSSDSVQFVTKNLCAQVNFLNASSDTCADEDNVMCRDATCVPRIWEHLCEGKLTQVKMIQKAGRMYSGAVDIPIIMMYLIQPKLKGMSISKHPD